MDASGLRPTQHDKERPVVIIRHNGRPFSSVECTVMCLGHGSQNQDHRTPELEPETHFTGISFPESTHLLPWSLHTIPPGTLNPAKGVGQLTLDGRKLVAREFATML